MDPARRSEYLSLMGLTEWVRRDHQAPIESPSAELSRTESPPVESPSEAAPSPPAGDDAVLADTPSAVVSAVVAADPVPVPEAAPPPREDREPIATQWEPLREQVARCTACALHETRTQTVFGVGVQRADLMLVGEGPGEQEDQRGEPFVGAAGQLLDRMLAAIGHSRQATVYIANVVKCRPPGNRKPHAVEAEACCGYLEAQIAPIQPKLIVALGQVAASGLLGEDGPVGRMRQGSHVHGASGTPVIVTYHPAYYLRQPREKRKGWEDLKRIRALLAELA